MSIFVWTGVDYRKAEALRSLLMWECVPITLKTNGTPSWQLAPSQIDLEMDDCEPDEAILGFFSDSWEYWRRVRPLRPDPLGYSEPAPALNSTIEDFEVEIDEVPSEEPLLDFLDETVMEEIRSGAAGESFRQACAIVRGLDAHDNLFAPGDAVCVHGWLDWDSLLVASYASAFGARVFYLNGSILDRRFELSPAPLIPGPNEPEIVALFNRHQGYDRHDNRAAAAFGHRTGNLTPLRTDSPRPEAFAGCKRLWDPEEEYDILVLGQTDWDPELLMAEALQLPNTRELCLKFACPPPPEDEEELAEWEEPPKKRVLYRPAVGETLEDLRVLEAHENVWIAPAPLREFIGRVGNVHALTTPDAAEMQMIGFNVFWHGSSWYKHLHLHLIPCRFRFISLARRYYCTIDNLHENVLGRLKRQTRRPLIPGQLP